MATAARFRKIEAGGWIAFDIGDGFEARYSPEKDDICRDDWESPFKTDSFCQEWYDCDTAEFLDELLEACREGCRVFFLQCEAFCPWPKES